MKVMTSVALFHSVLGVRPGVLAAADLLRSHGHSVTVVDQYDGQVFDDYQEAGTFAAGIGYPALMQSAAEAVSGWTSPFVVAGFSNGGGMAQYVAANHDAVIGALLLSGVIDPAVIGVEHWPGTVAVQTHYTVGDPFRNQAWLDAAEAVVVASGAWIETFDYPGAGHLFTDPSMSAEYQPDEAEWLWPRALAFLDRVSAVG
jgi:dienelactone hydrolase